MVLGVVDQVVPLGGSPQRNGIMEAQLTTVVFRTNDRTSSVVIHVRVAGAGAGVSAEYKLDNISATGRRTEVSPTGQQGATADWPVAAADIQSASGGLDSFELNTRNISFYTGTVSRYVKVTQSGRALPAIDSAGKPITPGPDGEVLLGTMASGASATDAIGIQLL